MVFEGIRSQRIDRKGQGSQALRVGGLRGGFGEDALSHRQRGSDSSRRRHSGATYSWGRLEAVDQPSRGPLLHTARLGVIQPRRRHESLLPMRIQLHQAVSDCWAVVWTCAWRIMRCIIILMRALGDRRLNYLGALSWPMITRQPCHAAPPDPPPSEHEKWLWETSTRQKCADLSLVPR